MGLLQWTFRLILDYSKDRRRPQERPSSHGCVYYHGILALLETELADMLLPLRKV